MPGVTPDLSFGAMAVVEEMAGAEMAGAKGMVVLPFSLKKAESMSLI